MFSKVITSRILATQSAMKYTGIAHVSSLTQPVRTATNISTSQQQQSSHSTATLSHDISFAPQTTKTLNNNNNNNNSKQNPDKLYNLHHNHHITTLDPMQVFDRIDTNKDGVICRDEFRAVVAGMKYEELRFTMHYLERALAHNELSRGVMYQDKVDYDTADATTDVTHAKTKADTATDATTTQKKQGVSLWSMLNARVSNTLEVMISKIFPAGFGWQVGSTVAAQLGYSPEQWELFLCTGVGDALGVMLGHLAFCSVKKAVMEPTMNMTDQTHTAVLLGTAAFCSGTAWQPTVNFLHNTAHLSFNETLLGTGVVCTLAFFFGLRFGRVLYSRFLHGVEVPNYSNLKADIGLSVAIGGAGAFFVGTDVSFADNWLRPLVGVEASASPLVGSVLAGTSTALGFTAVQMAQNVTVPAGKAWLD